MFHNNQFFRFPYSSSKVREGCSLPFILDPDSKIAWFKGFGFRSAFSI